MVKHDRPVAGRRVRRVPRQHVARGPCGCARSRGRRDRLVAFPDAAPPLLGQVELVDKVVVLVSRDGDAAALASIVAESAALVRRLLLLRAPHGRERARDVHRLAAGLIHELKLQRVVAGAAGARVRDGPHAVGPWPRQRSRLAVPELAVVALAARASVHPLVAHQDVILPVAVPVDRSAGQPAKHRLARHHVADLVSCLVGLQQALLEGGALLARAEAVPSGRIVEGGRPPAPLRHFVAGRRVARGKRFVRGDVDDGIEVRKHAVVCERVGVVHVPLVLRSEGHHPLDAGQGRVAQHGPELNSAASAQGRNHLPPPPPLPHPFGGRT